MKKNKSCQGKCPKCNSCNITYFDGGINDPNYYQMCKCDDCETQFVEVYKMEYIESTYEG